MSDALSRPERLRGEAARLAEKLQGGSGPRYWRSLEELQQTPEFLEFLQREFPEDASTWQDPNGRRDFLRVMGASLALAGLSSACTRQPEERIVPYVKMPEQVVPGRPLFYATALLDRGYAKGVLVESHMGRPTKIEGNPEHPGSLGGSDVFMQAELLNLYDPDRSQTIVNQGEIRAWGSFLAAMRSALEAQRAIGGAGLRILTGCVTSPTLFAQLEQILRELPKAKWHQWEPLGRDNLRAGAVMAFGEPVETHYRFENADVVVSLEADFLSFGPASLRDARAFARRRKVSGHHAALNRLYVVESVPSLAGAMADHRLPLRSGEIQGFARALAGALGVGAGAAAAGEQARFVAAIAKDLQAAAGKGLVLAGDSQPPAVHALAHAINQKLGSVGQSVYYTAPVAARSVDHGESLRELAADLEGGEVSLLLMLGVNPAYDAPADVRFAQAMERAAMRVHLGPHENETSERCHWHVPQAHSLESWSDARACDGSVTILQPLIAPLFSGKTAHEVLAALSARPERGGYDIVREHWMGRLAAAAPAAAKPGAPAASPSPSAEFEKQWNRALHDGIVAGTQLPAKSVAGAAGVTAAPEPAAAPAAGLELAFRPDPTILDGRHANNGWLQETPKPFTKLTWENAVVMGPQTAERLGVVQALAQRGRGTVTDVVEVTVDGATLRGPAFVLPGHAEECLSVTLGYGRSRVGRVGAGAGFNAYVLRTQAASWLRGGVQARRTGERVTVASTQSHWSLEQTADKTAAERHIVRVVTQQKYNAEPEAIKHMVHDPPRSLTLYPEIHKYEGHAWAMSIDMNACIGCNACMVACQSENNIPVVGKQMVAVGREMHWIRIDRYYAGDPGRPETLETHHQPVPCMQCENAPCEVVCPVAATVHSDEGLNDMVYNRCIGTRYCGNNCPYKVRRFNFFLYNDWNTETLKLMRNPDVSVRSRGVMEKCTYCVQRINKVRIDARNQGRPIQDGEIQTACEQACPAQAIVFGDINDPQSRVRKLKQEPRDYSLLADLGTRPRTTYLGKVRNPNPELANG
jgi:molybdopterin-containing oxidoreductase family iron-sulfur binding subunit